MFNNSLTPISRKTNIITQEIGNELLIYDLKINKAFSLNETSVLIWQSCDGKKTISEIAQSLSVKLRSPITEDFVSLALDQLNSNNLIENGSGSEIPSFFKGTSRRDMIRKVGLSTLTALPIVVAISAPTSAQAASSCTPNDIGETCPTAPGTCCPANNTICCSNVTLYSGGVPVGTASACETYNPQPNGSACTGGCGCTSLFCNFGTCCASAGTGSVGDTCAISCDCNTGLDCVAGTCQAV